MRTKIILTIAAAMVLAGCGSKSKIVPGPDYMIVSDIEFVGGFPHTVELGEPEKMGFDIIGVLDLTVSDSLLIFSTTNPKAMWQFYSLPGLEPLGDFLVEGKGPNEFLFSPWVSDATFSERDGQKIATIYDYYRGELSEMNVTETLTTGQLSMVKLDAPVPADVMGFEVVGEDTFFCRGFSADLTSRDRYLLKGGEKVVPENLAKLNMTVLQPGEDFNLIGAHIGLDRGTGRIVEAPLTMNYINIYSPEGAFARTVCTDEKADNLSEIKKLGEEESYEWARYSCMRVFDGLIGVIRDGKVQLFDIDGNPLLELIVGSPMTGFDIDFNAGHLYTLNLVTEDFLRYDMGESLNFIR